MRRLITISTVVFLVILNINAWSGDVARFSFNPPEGWEFKDRPGMYYEVAKAAPKDGFAQNITVVDVVFEGSIEEFLELAIPNMIKMLPSYIELDRRVFVSDSGLRAIKISGTFNLGSDRFHQSIFVFEKGRAKFVVTASSLEKDAEALGPIIDKSMKTATIS